MAAVSAQDQQQVGTPTIFGPAASSAAAETGAPRTRSPSRIPRGATLPTSPEPNTKAHAIRELEKVIKALVESHKAQGQRMEAVVDAGKGHEKRLDQLDLNLKSFSDGLSVLGRHCQDSIAELDGKIRAHIGGTVSDLNAAMLAVDVALRGTMQGTQDKFAEFQGDAKELMSRTEKAVKQLQEK